MSTTSTSSTIEAILSLLDDPDPVVQRSIRDHLLQLGEEVVPALRNLTQSEADLSARHNAEENLRAIGRGKFRREFKRLSGGLVAGEDIDLESATLAIGYHRYPELDPENYAQQLDTMASMLEGRVRGCDNGYMVVRELNRYLIDQLGFRGCSQDRQSFYDPDHSCINRVIDRRVGNPVGLSVVYLLVGRRLGIPLQGVGFPSHFLLKYRSFGEEFFIDPFHGGQILNYSDCRRYLSDLEIDYRPEFLEPISNRRIVARIMRNLAETQRGVDPEITHLLEEAIDLLLFEAS